MQFSHMICVKLVCRFHWLLAWKPSFRPERMTFSTGLTKKLRVKRLRAPGARHTCTLVYLHGYCRCGCRLSVFCAERKHGTDVSQNRDFASRIYVKLAVSRPYCYLDQADQNCFVYYVFFSSWLHWFCNSLTFSVDSARFWVFAKGSFGLLHALGGGRRSSSRCQMGLGTLSQYWGWNDHLQRSLGIHRIHGDDPAVWAQSARREHSLFRVQLRA